MATTADVDALIVVDRDRRTGRSVLRVRLPRRRLSAALSRRPRIVDPDPALVDLVAEARSLAHHGLLTLEELTQAVAPVWSLATAPTHLTGPAEVGAVVGSARARLDPARERLSHTRSA